VPVAIEPFVKLLQWLRAQPIEPLLRTRLYLNQTHILEDLEVLRRLRLPEPQPAADVVHWPRSCAKQLDDSKSVWFAQGGERFSVHDFIFTCANIRVNEYFCANSP
jgi:hypothetical protein